MARARPAVNLAHVAAADPTTLGGIGGWALQLMERLGVVGAAIAVALENLFPPLPSEVILPLAGFTASQGTFGLAEVIIWTTAGSVVGALALYGAGGLIGRERTRALIIRLPLVSLEDIDRSESFFARHGRSAVFFGRMVPVVRSLISIPAGVERMPIGAFVLMTAAGSGIWNTIFVSAGYLLGENWESVSRYADIFGWVVTILIVVLVVRFVVGRLRSRRASSR